MLTHPNGLCNSKIVPRYPVDVQSCRSDRVLCRTTPQQNSAPILWPRPPSTDRRGQGSNIVLTRSQGIASTKPVDDYHVFAVLGAFNNYLAAHSHRQAVVLANRPSREIFLLFGHRRRQTHKSDNGATSSSDVAPCYLWRHERIDFLPLCIPWAGTAWTGHTHKTLYCSQRHSVTAAVRAILPARLTLPVLRIAPGVITDAPQ